MHIALLRLLALSPIALSFLGKEDAGWIKWLAQFENKWTSLKDSQLLAVSECPTSQVILGQYWRPIKFNIFIRNLDDETKNANNAEWSGMLDIARAELKVRGLFHWEPLGLGQQIPYDAQQWQAQRSAPGAEDHTWAEAAQK